jgi:diacylglycerol kinase (ATP)
MSNTVFVVNPASGNGAAGRAWPGIAERADAYGLAGDVLFTARPGDAAALAEQAAGDGARLVVAVGGDGTVNEIVNGLLRGGGNGPELAVLPRGTGDDFARTFRIPSKVEAALEVAAGSSIRTIDLGRARFLGADGRETERYFANFAGAGISGAIARRGAATSRRLGAKAAYVWATVTVFARWTSVPMRIGLDEEIREGPMYEVIVANGVYAAGGMKIAPEASPDDGRFDAVLIGDVSKVDFVTTFPKIYRGTHGAHPKVDIVRARAVTVDADDPLPVVLDGEQPGTTPVRFEVVPAALRLRVPS